MKPYKVTYVDKEGKKVQRGFRNGVKETSLVEPSQWYIDNVMKPDQVKNAEREEKMERERKIARKMREIAERELENEEKSV